MADRDLTVPSLAGEPSRAPPLAADAGPPLRVTVENGNLKFVREPLLVGHYRSLRLTGTEAVLDDLVDGALKRSLDVNLYPDRPGTHAVFVNTRVDPEDPAQRARPEAVVVVGLGDEGKLGAGDLAQSVRQGTLAWARRLAEARGTGATSFDLAATLVGSGGTGISAGDAALAVTQGVRDANDRLRRARWPGVARLRLVELYRDRATEAWRALRALAAASPGLYATDDCVSPGTGALARPADSSYRGTDYDLVTVTVTADGNVAYALDTRRARHEVRAQATQVKLVEELVRTASGERRADPQMSRTLFRLLVPPALEPYLAGQNALLMSLDRGAAALPWEMLDAGDATRARGDAAPWAIRTRLVRQLRTAEFREEVLDVGLEAHALVVGEPRCGDPRFPALPGARREARAVAKALSGEPGSKRASVLQVRELVGPDGVADGGPDALTVVNALLERDWRVVHIAGHGVQPVRGEPGGVVLSNGTFLGPREIGAMRVVPELVFVNCCHLGSIAERAADAPGRAHFAATVAEALIALGVRCVVVAGWAVDDEAAREFATRFYGDVIAGARFSDAVANARVAARECGGNTWAAYQCYGDRDWTLRLAGTDPQRPAAAPNDGARFATDLDLRLALEEVTTDLRYGGQGRDQARARVAALEGAYGPRWGAIGAVAEAFGAAYGEAGATPEAIGWYRRALAAEDGSASIRACEQLGNLLARDAERRLAQDDGAKGAAGAALEAARRDLAQALELLERLVALHPTMERESLCGSAYKRKALVEARAGDAQAEAEAIEAMKRHYVAGERLAREAKDPDLHYPALNRMAAELLDGMRRDGWKGFDPADVASVRAALETRSRERPDFWSAASAVDLSLYEALAARDLASRCAAVVERYKDLRRRVSAAWLWASVRDQARFVLSSYARSAPQSELDAAHAMMDLLDGYAQQPRVA